MMAVSDMTQTEQKWIGLTKQEISMHRDFKMVQRTGLHLVQNKRLRLHLKMHERCDLFLTFSLTGERTTLPCFQL